MSRPARFLTFNFLLAAIEGLVVTWLFAAKPVDARTATALGASSQRILLVALAVAGVVLFSVLAARSWVKPGWAETFFTSLAQDRRKRPWLAVVCLVFALGWLGVFVPSDALNEVIPFYERLRPAELWITLVAGQTLVTLLVRGEWKNERPLLKMTGLALAIFLLIWAFMALTRIGLTPDDRYWNEAGVPLLWPQILLAWIASMGIGLLLSARSRAPAALLPRALSSGWVKDLLICVLLFASAAYLWTQTPVERSYFAPGPFPPNNVFYPYSDAQIYDLGAQYVFIGQGLNNNELSDKPFYVLFLALLHLLVGQDYSQVVRAQAAALAFFPVLIYLIAKLIHSRGAGILAGILAVLWETNSIASTLQIQVSHVRLMLTEFPGACVLALAAVVLILWFKNPRPASLKLVLTGGILGVAALTRPNSLLVVAVVLLLIVAVFGRKWRRTLPALGLFTLGFALVASPWYLVNKTSSGASFLEEKLRAVIDTRYAGNFTPTPQPVPPGTQATPTLQSLPTPPLATPAAAPNPTPPDVVSSSMTSPLQFVPAHFFHNLTMSVLILPLSFGSTDLATVLQAPYWKVGDILDLPPSEAIFLFFNLLVLALGLAAAWKTARMGGLVPMAVFLAYTLANALARNSGGRYLVPVNWIVFLYFGLGLVQLGLWGAALFGAHLETAASFPGPAPAAPGRPPHGLRNAVLVSAGLLAAGLSLLLIGSFFPPRYAAQDPRQLAQLALQRGSLQAAGVTALQAESLAATNGGMVVRGRALYPEFTDINPSAPTSSLNLSFQLIGPVSEPVILQFDSPFIHFPNAADVTVLGCGDGIYLWAQAVIIEQAGGPDLVYLRSPAPTWTCP